jgi:transposase
MEKIGLSSVLKKAFPEADKELLYLSMFQVLEGKPLYLFKPWAEAAYVEEPLALSSQRISRLAEELGRSEGRREMFLKSWIQSQGDLRAILFDITSLSSYSKFIEYLEWGYNRDGEKLPQINLGMIMGQPSHLPLAYRIYPGSIADVSTLKNIILLLGDWGVREFTFILDRGFYSASNLKEMDKEEIRFVLPLSFSTKISSQLISKHLRDLGSPQYGFYYQGRPMFYIKEETVISDVHVLVHLYHDERRKADEIDHLMRRIVGLEAFVDKKEFWSREEVWEHLEQARLFLTYLSLIIYSALSQIMKEQDLYKSYTLSEVIYELKKLRVVTLNSGKYYLTEISKKQRMLFEKFGVPIPVAP